jgi:hypothetical protein
MLTFKNVHIPSEILVLKRCLVDSYIEIVYTQDKMWRMVFDIDKIQNRTVINSSLNL